MATPNSYKKTFGQIPDIVHIKVREGLSLGSGYAAKCTILDLAVPVKSNSGHDGGELNDR